MSYMKQALQWVEENGLTNHPDALSMYLKTIRKEEEEDGNNKRNHSEESEHTKTMSRGFRPKS